MEAVKGEGRTGRAGLLSTSKDRITELGLVDVEGELACW